MLYKLVQLNTREIAYIRHLPPFCKKNVIFHSLLLANHPISARPTLLSDPLFARRSAAQPTARPLDRSAAARALPAREPCRRACRRRRISTACRFCQVGCRLQLPRRRELPRTLCLFSAPNISLGLSPASHSYKVQHQKRVLCSVS
jgi:hypothetical protein